MKPAYRRTPSTQNLRAERFWCFINQRVNYPLKAALREGEENHAFDPGNPAERFYVSWVSLQVAFVDVQLFLSAWNAYRIAGRGGGAPNVLAGRTASVGMVI